MHKLIGLTIAAGLAAGSGAAMAQPVLDHVDPVHAAESTAKPDEVLPHRDGPQILVDSVAATAGTAALEGVTVARIVIDDEELLDRRTLDAALAPFLGHRLAGPDLRELLTTVSGVARTQGLAFASSSIPQQQLVDGVLHVRLDPGRITKIEISGRDSKAVRAILEPLVGHPARLVEVERRLLLADDLPGVAVSNVTYGDGALRLTVAKVQARLDLAVDNRGIQPVGPLRASIGYDFKGLIDADRLSLGAQMVSSLAQPGELAAGSLQIAYVLDNSGTELSLSGSYSQTHPEGNLAALDIDGEGFSAELALSRPLLRSRKASLWLRGTLDYVSVDQWVSSNRVRRDRVALAGLALNGFGKLAGGRIWAGVAVAQSLDLAGATARGDLLASRPNAGPGATIFSGWVNWQGRLAGPFSARLAASGQLASAPLFVTSQLAIGGPGFGRAYDFNERSGDRGVLGLAELQYNAVQNRHGSFDWLQFYGFVDGGLVDNAENSLGTGSLASAGLGGRLGLFGKTKLELEAAFPLSGPRFDSGDSGPRLSAALGTRF